MHLVLTAVVVLFFTSCASSEEHLVPKHGIVPKHNVRKRDLSTADAELILKLLLSKLQHGAEETELLHKKVGSDKEHYLHGSDIMDKAHLASMKEEMKYPGKSEPHEHEYMREKHASFETDGYEMKKDVGLSEKDIMDIIMKMKDLTASKGMEDAHKREVYYGTPEKVHLEEKIHLSKEAAMKGASGKMLEHEMYPDKVSDKDVSLAESLYHMSIAGDIETYPDIKMASLTEMYGKNIDNDKLHLEEAHSLHKVNSEESFMKKVDDVGKTMLKEEAYPHIKEDNIEEYLKKVAEEEKVLYYDEKVGYPNIAFSLEKTSEEKALDEWKASHKDVFTAEEGAVLGKDFKLEGAYHTKEGIDDEMNDELMKQLKSFGINKEMGSELLHLFKESQYAEGGIAHEMSDEFKKKLKSFGIDKEVSSELLHLFKESHYAEGGLPHEMGDEFMKKLKSFGIDKEMGSELLHLFEKSQHAEGGIAHEMSDEFMKKIKSLGIDNEMSSELLHLFKEPHYAEGGLPHEMGDELMKKLKSFGIDKEMGSELLRLFTESQHAEGGIAHEMSDEFMKKLKSIGIEKEMGSELLHLFKDSHYVEGGIAHEMSDEFIKKLKSLGIDKEMGAEILHLSKDLHYAEGGVAPEMNEELMKKLKSLGIDKEMGAELLHFSKELNHAEGGIATEISDEMIKKLKTLGMDKEMGIGHDELLHLSKSFYNADGSMTDEMGDEIMKKAKALGLDKEMGVKHDEHLHFSKEFHKEEGVAEGSTAYEKALEQARKDAHVRMSEEEMKKHDDESLKFGAKDAHGTGFFEKGLTAEKTHGIDTKMGVGIEKSLHGIYGEETIKSKESHGLGEAFAFEKEKGMYGGKVAFDDEFKHSKSHEIPLAFEGDKLFKAHEDELMKKGTTYGTDSLFHKDEEILKTASDHHIPHVIKDEEEVIVHDKHHAGGAEKSHTVFHDLKTKFFELLKRVLRTRKCHLVTMRPSELLSIVNCISKSKDPVLCEKFSMCEKKMPFRVLRAKEKCQQETIPGGMKHCTRYAPLFPSPEIPVKLFQCVALNVRELIPEEKKHMIDFEECARALKAESCARFKLFRGPH